MTVPRRDGQPTPAELHAAARPNLVVVQTPAATSARRAAARPPDPTLREALSDVFAPRRSVPEEVDRIVGQLRGTLRAGLRLLVVRDHGGSLLESVRDFDELDSGSSERETPALIAPPEHDAMVTEAFAAIDRVARGAWPRIADVISEGWPGPADPDRVNLEALAVASGRRVADAIVPRLLEHMEAELWRGRRVLEGTLTTGPDGALMVRNGPDAQQTSALGSGLSCAVPA